VYGQYLCQPGFASGQHVLVQAFSFGRIDNGVFTALPGAPPSSVPFAAAAW
jgi:hypothetical protein